MTSTAHNISPHVQLSVTVPYKISGAGGTVEVFSSSVAVSAIGRIDTKGQAVTVDFYLGTITVASVTVQQGQSLGFTVTNFDTVKVSASAATNGEVTLLPIFTP